MLEYHLCYLEMGRLEMPAEWSNLVAIAQRVSVPLEAAACLQLARESRGSDRLRTG
jgi:hypothetical protein